MAKETVKKLSSNLLRKSSGLKIANGDRVLVYYQGTLLNGEEFDANFDFSTFEQVTDRDPFPFNLGVGEVIEGWDKGLKKKRIGSVVELTIPSDQAYGEAGAGDLIPPNSPLKFTVEVLAALPAGSSTAVFADYSDFGINTKKIGLSDELIETTTSLKIGLDSADELVGTSSNDLLIGLKGNDRMLGTRGADVLIGGSGKNTFVYEKVKDSLAAKGKSDHILDFGRKDKIDLSSVAKELRFIGSDPFSGTAGDVRFKKGTLELDKDGDGVADLALQLPGTNTKFLKASNLIL
jgi:Ca2+-binding RTX toxin-like protein